jgi:hypothetical protein
LKYFVNTQNDPDKIAKTPNNYHIKRLIESIFGANVDDFTGLNLSNVWLKNEYYQQPSGSDYPNAIIPSLHLHKNFMISRDDGDYRHIPLEIITFSEQSEISPGEVLDPGEFDIINIGFTYYTELSGSTGSIEESKQMSRSKINMDYNSWRIKALHNRNVLTINENQLVDSSFEYAYLNQNDVNIVLSDDISGFDPSGMDITKKFAKFADPTWQKGIIFSGAGNSGSKTTVKDDNDDSGKDDDESTDIVSTQTFFGLGQDIVNNVDIGKRFLTGRHYKIVMGLFDKLFHWVRSNFLDKDQEDFLCPPGTVIAYTPPIAFSSIQGNGGFNFSQTNEVSYQLPKGWIPCMGGFYCEQSPNGTRINYRDVPNLRNRLVYGYNFDQTKLIRNISSNMLQSLTFTKKASSYANSILSDDSIGGRYNLVHFPPSPTSPYLPSIRLLYLLKVIKPENPSNRIIYYPMDTNTSGYYIYGSGNDVSGDSGWIVGSSGGGGDIG